MFNFLKKKEKAPPQINREKKTYPESQGLIRPDVDDIVETASQYDVISFDIFDTLILRPFSDPKDVFYILECINSRFDFKDQRISAENSAREKTTKSNFEVDIRDIYQELSLYYNSDMEKDIELEYAVELEVCYANPYMKRVYDKLLKMGKKIILTSDMYLPSSFLKQLLSKNGYTGYADIFVSCEFGVSKINGGLQEIAQKHIGEQLSYIHIGDNLQTDINGSKINGWATIHYNQSNEYGNQYRIDTGSPVCSIYKGVINNYLHCGEYHLNKYEEFGFIYCGILVQGFCEWIHKICSCRKIDKILFMARDMDIFYKIYSKMEEHIDCAYLNASRFALQELIVEDYPMEFIFHTIHSRLDKGKSIQQAFLEADLKILADKLPEDHLHGDAPLSSKNYQKVVEYILKHKKEIVDYFEPINNVAKEYFTTAIKGSKNICICDLGWRGSEIAYLKYLFEEKWKLNVNVSGILLGSTSSNCARDLISRGIVTSYLFNNVTNREFLRNYNWEVEYINLMLIEAIFTSEDPSLIKYVRNNNGMIDFLRYANNPNADITHEIQKGINLFIDIFNKYRKPFKQYFPISSVDAYVNLHTILANYEYMAKVLGDVKDTPFAIAGLYSDITYIPIGQLMKERNMIVAWPLSLNECKNVIEENVQESCIGCGICIPACPTKALMLTDDSLGFKGVRIDQTKCTHCSKCTVVCPLLNVSKTKSVERIFYKIDGVQYTSLLLKILEYYIKNNAIVCCDLYTDGHIEKTLTNNIYLIKENISVLCQTQINKCAQKIKHLLKAHKKIIFVGTPLQISALKNYLVDYEESDLITIDVGTDYLIPYSIMKKCLSNSSSGNANVAHYTDSGLSCTKMTQDSEYVNAFKNAYCNSLFFKNKTEVNFRVEGYSDISLMYYWDIFKQNKEVLLTTNSKMGSEVISKSISKSINIKTIPNVTKTIYVKTCPDYTKDYFTYLTNITTIPKAIDYSLNEKYDVGLVCVQNLMNYGSQMLNYSLLKVFEKMGLSVLFIVQPATSTIAPTDYNNFNKDPFNYYLKSRIFANTEEMDKLNEKCKSFVVGSDQLFNYNIYSQLSDFIKLKWVDESKPKLSFATSFGHECIFGEETEFKDLINSLSKFGVLSLRENKSVELLKQYNLNAQECLSPTLITGPEDYIPLIRSVDSNKLPQKGICAYILDPSTEKCKFIKKIATSKKLSAYSIIDMWRTPESIDCEWDIETLNKVSNEEWLYELYHASMVITDSYSGLCFAILFNKPFIAIINTKRGALRFESLSKQLDLREFVIYEEELQEYTITKEPSYQRINSIISNLRKASISKIKEYLLTNNIMAGE